MKTTSMSSTNKDIMDIQSLTFEQNDDVVVCTLKKYSFVLILKNIHYSLIIYYIHIFGELFKIYIKIPLIVAFK